MKAPPIYDLTYEDSNLDQTDSKWNLTAEDQTYDSKSYRYHWFIILGINGNQLHIKWIDGSSYLINGLMVLMEYPCSRWNDLVGVLKIENKREVEV